MKFNFLKQIKNHMKKNLIKNLDKQRTESLTMVYTNYEKAQPFIQKIKKTKPFLELVVGNTVFNLPKVESITFYPNHECYVKIKYNKIHGKHS